MIETHYDDGKSGDWIDIRPNRSLNWHQIRLFAVILAIPATIIAIGCVILGAWMIVPFSGLELGAALVALWLVSLRGQRREVVRFLGDSVTVEKGVYRCNRRRRFQRHWSRFEVERSDHPWYAPRIILRQHNQQEEIGSFLNEEEKGLLIRELQALVQRVKSRQDPVGSNGP